MPPNKIAERIFDLQHGETLRIILYQPQIDTKSGGDWECTVNIGEQTLTLYGVDSFQALLHAIQIIKVELDLLKNKNQLDIKWLGMDDFGF